LPRIFDPFFTTKNQARGLGLAAAYSIMQRHGGYIGVQSTLGAGTTAIIYFPASRSLSSVEPAATAPRRAMEEKAPPRLRVLVMDDEEPIRQLIEMTLDMLHHEVVCTPDGDAFLAAHAAAKATGRPFDVAVLDLTIPGGMGGKEAIRRLRERDQNIRAIVSSGYSNDPVMAQCADYGFDAVLPKPYQVKDLIQLVQQLGNAPRNGTPQVAAA
jgi:CheY-like chemotaxis protein